MAIESDDSDIRKSWLICFFGGNGDPYIQIVSEDDNGIKTVVSTRIAVSGGNAPTEVKIAAANLAREMTRLNLNEYPE